MILVLFISGQASAYFQTSFGSPGTDAGRSVKQLTSGSIFVCGYSDTAGVGKNSVALTKLSSTGTIQWMKFLSDSLSSIGLHLSLDHQENLIICGQSAVEINNDDAFVCKLDTNGNLIWFKRYAAPLNQSFKYIKPCTDKGFIACGYTSDLSGSNDFFCVKLDSLGAIQWQGNYGGSFNDYAMMVHQTADGGFIISGDTNSDGAGGYDVEVIRLTATGSVVWDKLFGDSLQNGCQGILPLSTGGYLSYGETETPTSGAYDFFMRKTDSLGNDLLLKTFGGIKSDAIFSVCEASNGDFVFTGYSNSFSSGSLNLVIARTDSNCNLLWIHNFGANGVDIGYEIIPEKNAGYLVLGTTYQNASDEFFLLNVNDSGTVVGISENNYSHESLTLSPNPVKDRLSITIPYPSHEPVHISIHNLLGDCIQSSLVNANGAIKVELKLDSKIIPGYYLLNVFYAQKNYSTKICVTE